MTKRYTFSIQKNEHGEPVFSFVADECRLLDLTDILELDQSITVSPTRESYAFVELLFDELYDYLRKQHQYQRFDTMVFPERKEISLTSALGAFIENVINDGIGNDNKEQIKGILLEGLFAINGMTWVIGSEESPDCHVVKILDGSKYPIVKVVESTCQPVSGPDGELSVQGNWYSVKWLNFNNLITHFPIFD
jgi:hypothetical protein